MSTIQVPADHQHPDLTQNNSKRPSADFHPSIWGDYFLGISHSNTETCLAVEKMKQRVEELKEDVKNILLMDSNNKPLPKLELIDAIQRLGVSYHFEREIDQVLENMHSSYSFRAVVDKEDDYCLYIVALCFRLLRQHGYFISCDVFNKFKDGEGNFKASLTMDVPGMLSLYEAAHLRIRGEEILDEALAFTTTHLQSFSTSTRISPDLAEKVFWALKNPIRKNIPRLETRHYISIYPKEDSHSAALLKLAELDFNVLQILHQKEASNITKWWKDLDFVVKLPYARDRVIELYSWILGIYFEPQYSFAREIATKVMTMVSILDDTFDAHGTYEELNLFTQAIKRWDISSIDVLPDYMKLVYHAILDVYNEIEEHTAKEGLGRSYCVHYAKEAMKELVQAYFDEARWLHDDYTPTMDEYMSVATVTATYFIFSTVSFIGMGKIATEEMFQWVFNKPKIITASSVIGRLMNDIVSHKSERKRVHVASAVECCMKQQGVKEEEAYKIMGEEIENAWKDINQEFLKPTSIVANPLLERILNLTRVTDVMYKGGDDCYTNPHKNKHNIELLLLHPITPIHE